jgi:alkanesulfonate monooxygenase SsuD/methylene tetrahydromethanopterin reductase-like flavin-dependent oxidoreductase (luciferase family)
VGAYRPRMLRLTGRLGDGWLPSLGRIPAEEIAAMHQTIDDSARQAGRDPGEIVRAVNVGGDDAAVWLDPDHVAGIAERHRFDVLIVSLPDQEPLEFIGRLGATAAALRS